MDKFKELFDLQHITRLLVRFSSVINRQLVLGITFFFSCFTFLANFITTISFHRECSMPYHFVSVICQTINIYRYKLYRARTNTLHSMLRINTRCRHECRLDTQQNSFRPATYASIAIATSNHIYCIDV